MYDIFLDAKQLLHFILSVRSSVTTVYSQSTYPYWFSEHLFFIFILILLYLCLDQFVSSLYLGKII